MKTPKTIKLTLTDSTRGHVLKGIYEGEALTTNERWHAMLTASYKSYIIQSKTVNQSRYESYKDLTLCMNVNKYSLFAKQVSIFKAFHNG